MTTRDFRGCAISGASAGSLERWEQALHLFLAWRRGAAELIDAALAESPAFAMARVLRAYLQICSRDPDKVRGAGAVLARGGALTPNRREAMHLHAIGAVLADDYDGARRALAALLQEEPRDVLAVHVLHHIDYIVGDSAAMGARIPPLLHAWSSDVPGYSSILAMHAFALEECGEYDRAAELAHRALSLDAFDARIHHVLAHVFEMTGRSAAGRDWMLARRRFWSADGSITSHLWWHLALFELGTGRAQQALALYDAEVESSRPADISELIDAAALLWRLRLAGERIAGRARSLAAAWAPHIGDGFCSFNDLHAMMAFVAAGEPGLARRLERGLSERARRRTRHGETTRHVGLPACRALMAYGAGDYGRCIALLASLPPLAHRLGGSHAQRDVLDLTLAAAVAESDRVEGSPLRPQVELAAPAPQS